MPHFVLFVFVVLLLFKHLRCLNNNKTTKTRTTYGFCLWHLRCHNLRLFLAAFFVSAVGANKKKLPTKIDKNKLKKAD
jgi:hypothetical protein